MRSTVVVFAVMVAVLAMVSGCAKMESPVGIDSAALSMGVLSGVFIPEDESCVTLVAGQNIDAGTVCITVEGTDLLVTYTTLNEWELVETHVWIGESAEGYPQTRQGNPKIGHFPYSSGDITGATSWSVLIPMDQFGIEDPDSPPGENNLCGMTLYVAAHAALQLNLGGEPPEYQEETGWGAGADMDGASWAMLFSVTLSCDGNDPGVSEDCETAFAYGGETYANCFLSIDEDNDGNVPDFMRWGWSNGPLAVGSYTFDIYAGAGQCDWASKGTHVGELTVDYDGSTAIVSYTMFGGFATDEIHLYVGSEILPRDVNGEFTVAPGQYPPYIVGASPDPSTNVCEVRNLSGDIYVVAHAVVCIVPCVPGFDEEAFGQVIDDANNVDGYLKMKVTYPTSGGEAYFNPTYIDYNNDGVAEVETQSWCVDIGNTIANNTWYCALLVSSYDDLTGLVDKPENMDLVNYVLNQDYVYAASPSGGNYTYGDVQYAIWTLIDNQASTSGIGTWTPAHVDEIVAAAQANGENYTPPCDGVAGALLVPVACGTTTPATVQVIIAQVTVANYPSICYVCP